MAKNPLKPVLYQSSGKRCGVNHGSGTRGAKLEGTLESQFGTPVAGAPVSWIGLGERRLLGTAALDGVGAAGMKATTGGWVHRIGTFSLELDRARRDSLQLDFGSEPVCSA
jgi:hypothetical protein